MMQIKQCMRMFFLLGMLLAMSGTVSAEENHVPYERDFILTAYYSPLPDQCCYVLGSEEADKVMNGMGIQGADGTAVYSGMVAAPSTYAFGTVINLPGFGVVAVHDRGGAIVERENADRLDVWVGYGEEGLARALAFGVKHMRGTVYADPAGTPAESLDIGAMNAPLDALEPYQVWGGDLLNLSPRKGDRSYSTVIFQRVLKELGYFAGTATGVFGSETLLALEAFSRSAGVGIGDGVTREAAAYLTAAIDVYRARKSVPLVSPGENGMRVAEAKRLMRSLGYYRGRTDKQWNDGLFAAILRFQQEHRLVGDAQSPGAGAIGPITSRTLFEQWQKSAIAKRAEMLLARAKVEDILAQRNQLVGRFLQEGHAGPSVRALQQALASRGFFPAANINGVYGALTKKSVLQYQLSRHIVTSDSQVGAGMIGPATLAKLRSEQVTAAEKIVRNEGWQAL